MFLTVEIFVAAHASDRVCDFGGTFEDTLLAAASAKKSVQFVKGRTIDQASTPVIFLTMFLKSGNSFDYMKNLRNTKINDPKNNKQKHLA